jgi:hypothetical protein
MSPASHCQVTLAPTHKPWNRRDRAVAGNSIAFRILFPSPYRVEISRLRQQLDEAHLAWVVEWKQRQADFVIENIRFAHDPNWNKRVFSLQAAHDGETWVWGVTHMIVMFGGMSI